MTGALLGNSLMAAGGTALLSAVLGFLAAIAVVGWRPAVQRSLVVLAVIILALPPFLVTNSWLESWGPQSHGGAFLPIPLQSLTGTVVILAFMFWPVSFLLTLAAWRRLETAQIDTEPALRGTFFLRHLLWPMARPYLATGAMVTFALALNNFTVPAILQVPVLPAILWVRFNTHFDLGAAWRLGWPLVLIPCAMLWILRWAPIKWPRESGGASPQRIRSQVGATWSGMGAAVLMGLLLLSLALPMGQLVLSPQTWTELPVVMRTVPGAIWNSFAWPTIAATACLALGFVLRQVRWGWVLWVPFLVPGIALGIALIELLNRPYLQFLYASPGMVVMAWAIRYGAAAWLGLRLAARELDRDLSDVARLHGGAGWLLWWNAHGPPVIPIAGAVWYLTYLLCLWDVETLILIVPPGGETLALRAFNLLHYGHNAQVNAMCLLLVLLALAPGLAWHIGRWIILKRKAP